MQTSTSTQSVIPFNALEHGAIAGVNEPTILNYFDTINAGDFSATSQLFAPEGVLQPPFEELIVGPDAIAVYLEKEAKGFILQPQQGTSIPIEDDCIEYQIGGCVQTPWFSVNVSWLFILSPNREILHVTIKLLASLKELARLRR